MSNQLTVYAAWVGACRSRRLLPPPEIQRDDRFPTRNSRNIHYNPLISLSLSHLHIHRLVPQPRQHH